MSNSLRRVIAVAAAVLFLASCASNKKEVSFRSGNITQTFSEGKSAAIKNFPLPIYPHAAPSGEVTASNDEDSENSKFLILTSKDKLPDVANFYRQALPAGGWKPEVTQSLPNLLNINVTREDMDGSVMVSGSERGTTITLSTSKGRGTPITTVQKNYTLNKLNPPTD